MSGENFSILRVDDVKPRNWSRELIGGKSAMMASGYWRGRCFAPSFIKGRADSNSDKMISLKNRPVSVGLYAVHPNRRKAPSPIGTTGPHQVNEDAANTC
jgi:hypothetical protein